jgi:uncharacterized membrane protein YkoI
MTRRITIAALFAALGLAAVTAGAAAPAFARDCGRCAPGETAFAQYRGQSDADAPRRRPPFLRAPAAEDRYYGGAANERRAITMPAPGGRQPLTDDQIWSIAKSRVPGRIVNARLHGPTYSFRIISHRGSIVDVVVDRFTGRIVSVRGGP